MKNTIARAALITLALTGAWIPSAMASWPAGVWVHAQKVVYDNPADPSTIEIHGAIMVHNGDNMTMYPGYSNPALGYMYYTCPAGMKATCQLEWKDIEANIGTPDNTCVGLGADVLPPGTLRGECVAPAKPDNYPISMGVMPAFSPCQVIGTFLMSMPDGGTCGSSSSSATSGSTSSSAAGNPASTSASTGSAMAGSSSSSSAGAGGAGGGSSSSGGGKGCSCGTAPETGAGLFGLAIPALAAGIALRKSSRRRRAR